MSTTILYYVGVIVLIPPRDGYGRGYKIEDAPVNQLTHLVYAFGDIKPDGTM
jgi:GH18 family chitinase